MKRKLSGRNGVTGLFGTSGIRGVVNKDHYPDFYLRMGLIFGIAIRDKKIAMAADGRVTMHMVKNAITSGLNATGHDIVEIGILPTPALQYYCKNKKIPGVMVTASHNPAEYNGIKLVMENGLDVYREEHSMIEEMHWLISTNRKARDGNPVIKYAPWNAVGKIEYDGGGRGMYINGIAKLVDTGKIKRARLRILFDCVNGSTTQTAPYLLNKLGANVVPLNEDLDGSFPAHPPEPTMANIKGTVERVRESGVDFGVVFDSDGDRSVFISPEGRYLDGNYSMPMIVKSRLRKGDSVVAPVNTADSLRIVCEEMGIDFYNTKIGAPNIIKEMIRRKAKAGGEENGGIIFAPHQYGRDGGMALALISEAVAKYGLDEMVESLPEIHYLRDKVRSSLEFAEVRRRMLEHKHLEKDETDGIKIMLTEDEWVMVRKSGTEPVYRIYAQAGSEGKVESLIKGYKKSVFGA